jgi:ketosteroid isomerase-like protein
MKLKTITIVVFCLITTVIFGQTKSETQLKTAVEAFRKAMVDADKTTLDQLTAKELSYGHSGGKVEDKAAFIDALTSGESDFVTIELSDQTVEIVGKIAVVRHTLAAATNNGGKATTVKLHVLNVWQKQSGNWKLLARQAVKI